MKFGAFIITFNRSEILPATILTIFAQSFPPDHILIIDNSPERTAKPVFDSMNREKISYHAMGFNGGPAGAANFGLRWFKEQGYDWVYWGDDNDPPEIRSTFERIFTMIGDRSEKLGIAGAVGQLFDFSKGRVIRLKDEALKGYLEVDIVSGTGSMIVSLQAVNERTLPDPELFFGFEEFEFCLKMKKAGYHLLVHGELMREHRQKYGRLGFNPKRAGVRSKGSLWREYYSIRNLIYIFFKVYPEYRHIAIYRIFAAFGKMAFGFKYGFRTGVENAKYQVMAVHDGLRGKLGMKNFRKL